VRGDAPARVVVALPDRARAMRAWLNDVPLKSRFRRRQGRLFGRLTARDRMRLGLNNLRLEARGRAGRSYAASVRFVRARRARSLVALSRPRRRAAGTIPVAGRLGGRASAVELRVNGRRVAERALRPRRGRLSLRLGAHQGLRFGRNRVELVAYRNEGVYDSERRTVFLTRRRPLVGAGPDRVVRAGRPIRLDGRASRAWGGARLAYRWRVVRAPRPARLGLAGTRRARPRLRLAGRRGARPRLRVRTPGRYRVALTVRARGLAATDVADVLAQPDLPPIGAVVDTTVTSGGGAAIQVGDKVVGPIPEVDPVSGPTVAVVLVDRGTAQVVDTELPGRGTNIPADFALDYYLERVAKGQTNPPLPTDVLAVVRGQPGCCANTELPNDGFAAVFRVKNDPDTHYGLFSWSSAFVNAGLQLSDGRRQPTAPGHLYGYLRLNREIDPETLVPSPTRSFAFVQSDVVTFDTVAGGRNTPAGQNTIAVQDKSYTSKLPAPATSGFQVLVLDSALRPLFGTPTAFGTNTAGGASNREQLGAMASLLGQAAQTRGAVVLVQSIGAPKADSAWGEVADRLEALNATRHVVLMADGTNTAGGSPGGYALVGGREMHRNPAPTAEASSAVMGKPAELTGVLRRNPWSQYAPVSGSMADDLGDPTINTMSIAYQPSAAWPMTDTLGRRAVLAWLAQPGQLGLVDASGRRSPAACTQTRGDDVRAAYCVLSNDWDGLAVKLGKIKYEAGQGFTREEFNDVTKQLGGEFLDVAQLAHWSVWFQIPVGTAAANAPVALETIAKAVRAAIPAPPHRPAGPTPLELVGSLIDIGAEFIPEEEAAEQAAFGVVGMFMELFAPTLDEPDGDSAVENPLQTEVDQLGIEIDARYQVMRDHVLDSLDLFVSDPGKLQAAAPASKVPWGISAPTIGNITGDLARGARQWLFTHILGATYQRWWLPAGSDENQRQGVTFRDLFCTNGYDDWHPFRDAPASAGYKPYGYIGADGKPYGNHWWVLVGGSDPIQRWDESYYPGDQLMKQLFTPPPGGEGLYAPWFLAWTPFDDHSSPDFCPYLD
jgi:hypothetical protein